MVGQSFFFNAVFFTYGLVVAKFYHVDAKQIPVTLLPFATANFFGPLALGRLFDKIGRKPMITATYGISGSKWNVSAGYFLGAALMLAGAVAE